MELYYWQVENLFLDLMGGFMSDELKLILYPNKILTKSNRPITRELLYRVLPNIEKMENILKKHDGVGLAAPQVGINLRFNIIRYKECNINMLDPYILSHGKDFDIVKEGCISLPDVTVSVKRFKMITVWYYDENWIEKKEVFEGLCARIIQHEVDHLDGILLTHRMSHTSKIKNRNALRLLRYMAENENTDNSDATTA